MGLEISSIESSFPVFSEGSQPDVLPGLGAFSCACRSVRSLGWSRPVSIRRPGRRRRCSAGSRRRSPQGPHTAIHEGSPLPDSPEPVTICRPRHPYNGAPVTVIGLRNTGTRGQKVKLRLPDGTICWLPLSWTSLGAAPADGPRLAGTLSDLVALRNLLCVLEERCGAVDGARATGVPLPDGAGVGRTVGALVRGSAGQSPASGATAWRSMTTRGGWSDGCNVADPTSHQKRGCCSMGGKRLDRELVRLFNASRIALALKIRGETHEGHLVDSDTVDPPRHRTCPGPRRCETPPP